MPKDSGEGRAQAEIRSPRLCLVAEEIDRQLAQYRRRRRRDKRKSFSLQMSTVGLSAAITVLLGLRPAEPWRGRFTDTALVLGAIVTVAAAAEAFFAHRELWIIRTGTVRRLEALRRRLLTLDVKGSSSRTEEAVLDAVLSDLEGILAEDLRQWLAVRSTRSSTGDVADGFAPRESRSMGSESEDRGQG